MRHSSLDSEQPHEGLLLVPDSSSPPPTDANSATAAAEVSGAGDVSGTGQTTTAAMEWAGAPLVDGTEADKLMPQIHGQHNTQAATATAPAVAAFTSVLAMS